MSADGSFLEVMSLQGPSCCSKNDAHCVFVCRCCKSQLKKSCTLCFCVWMLQEPAQEMMHNVFLCADAARASKADVLLLYANKWQQHIMQSCVSLAQVLQVPDAAPLQAAIQASWLFTDQVTACGTCTTSRHACNYLQMHWHAASPQRCS